MDQPAANIHDDSSHRSAKEKPGLLAEAGLMKPD